MLFSILQVFILIWIEKSYPLLGESIQNGLFCIFQAIHNFLDLKQKQYNTKVKVKKKKANIYNVESDLFFPITCVWWECLKAILLANFQYLMQYH